MLTKAEVFVFIVAADGGGVGGEGLCDGVVVDAWTQVWQLNFSLCDNVLQAFV